MIETKEKEVLAEKKTNGKKDKKKMKIFRLKDKIDQMMVFLLCFVDLRQQTFFFEYGDLIFMTFR